MEEENKIYDIFEEQPAECRLPLPAKALNAKQEYQRRVLTFDPHPIYERLRFKLNPYERYNYIQFFEMFPDNENLCACGCGKELTGRRKRWATNDCQKFAVAVWEILSGRAVFSRFLLNIYDGGQICRRCGGLGTDLDHIIPIQKGGGACWISNFQMLCNPCHKVKTREDFGWKKLTRKTNKYKPRT